MEQKTLNGIRLFVGWYFWAQGLLSLAFLMSLAGHSNPFSLIVKIITSGIDPLFALLAAFVIPPSVFFMITGNSVLEKTASARKLVKIAAIIAVIASVFNSASGKPEYDIWFFVFTGVDGVAWFLVDMLKKYGSLP